MADLNSIGEYFTRLFKAGNKRAASTVRKPRRVVVVRRQKQDAQETNRRWIQRAIRRPKALTVWLKRHRDKVREVTGVDPFTKKGEIRQLALIRLKRSDWYQRLSTRTKRRINLAITLERLQKR